MSLLIHEAQQPFEDDSALHDSGPRQNGFHVFFECGIEDGSSGLHHAPNVVVLLAGIREPIKHSQLLIEQILCFVLEFEFRRRQRAVCELLGLVEQPLGGHGV